jgi:UDP-N-acetylmuramate--alanine ligase
MFGKTKKIHFIGIGGIGMCGIAELLHYRNFEISGSDQYPSENTERLQKLGLQIHIGHQAENVPDCDLVVYSSAVRPDNPEMRAADQKNIIKIRRAEMLAEIMKNFSTSIGVSGTHGKTTTTGMLASILEKAGLDPILINGGISRQTHSTIRTGAGDYIVVEADEFDRSFLRLAPTHAVITTIEAEHLDCYTSLDEIKQSFIQYANSIPFYGGLAICLDEPELTNIVASLKKRFISYGITSNAQLKAQDIHQDGLGSIFTVLFHNHPLGKITLQVPGAHNIKNALAATGVALLLDLNFQQIAEGLHNFAGIKRRFEIVKSTPDYILIDDYAHHPTEIRVTLAAAQRVWQRRIVAIFQPHLYSRTKDFYQEFAQALYAANEVIILDVYPAREEPIQGVSGALIADSIRQLGHGAIHYIPQKNELLPAILKIRKPGDLIITLGAGDVNRVLDQLKEIN